MHILELTDFYRPVIGGLERHVETLSRELVHLGHTVTVVTLQTGDDPAEEILDGTRHPYPRMERRPNGLSRGCRTPVPPDSP